MSRKTARKAGPAPAPTQLGDWFRRMAALADALAIRGVAAAVIQTEGAPITCIVASSRRSHCVALGPAR